MNSSFEIGPFHLYRSNDGTLDISITLLSEWACGWEYGWRDSMRGLNEKPVIEFRIGKLMILYLEFYPGGCEIWFMGFWGFPTWRKVNVSDL